MNPAPPTAAAASNASEVPEVERTIAFDMLRRGALAGPVLVLVAGLVRGTDGAVSVGVAVAIVLVNLLASAVALSWAAKISATALMAVALGGFVVRMMAVTAFVWAAEDAPWIDLSALAVGLLVTHLGLLFWELRYVSASLAYPGLKPAASRPATNKEAPTS